MKSIFAYLSDNDGSSKTVNDSCSFIGTRWMRQKSSLPYHSNRIIVIIIIAISINYYLLNSYFVTGMLQHVYNTLSNSGILVLWSLLSLPLHSSTCLIGKMAPMETCTPKVQTHMGAYTGVKEQNQRFATGWLWANFICAWETLNSVGHFN